MGTTFMTATYYKNGKIDRKAECDAINTCTDGYRRWKVLKSSMVGTIYYGAIEISTPTDRDVVAVVFKTYTDGGDFGYKDMDETMIPCYYDCPKSILDLLTPTDNEYANEWRRLCREKKPSEIKKAKIGDRIKWTRYDGSEYILIKHAPAYQFKTWFWFCPQTGNYVKKSLINDKNAVLV